MDISYLLQERRAMEARVATVAFALVLGACRGTPAVNLRPDNIPPGHGAVFGRVEVFKGQSDVTGACYISFTDESNEDRKSTRLNSSHSQISYAVFCLKQQKRHH